MLYFHQRTLELEAASEEGDRALRFSRQVGSNRDKDRLQKLSK